MFCFKTDATVSPDSLSPRGDFVFGTWEIPLVVLKKEVEAGGMATVVNVLFGQISMVFIRVVDIKPGPISTGEE